MYLRPRSLRKLIDYVGVYTPLTKDRRYPRISIGIIMRPPIVVESQTINPAGKEVVREGV